MSALASSVQLEATRPNRLPVLLTIVLLLGPLAVAGGVALGIRGGNLATLALSMMIAVVALLPVIFDQARPIERRNILLALFCLVYIARYTIPPLILYLPERGPIDAPGMYMSMLRPWDVATGQFVVLIALISYLIGHSLPLVRMLGARIHSPRLDWSPGITFGVGVGLILLGWPISLAATFGLIPAALGSGVISTLGSSLVYGHVLLALAYFRYGMRSSAMVLAFTIPVTFLIGFLSGSKTSAVLAPAFVALTYIFERRKIPVTFMAIGVLALAVMYPASEFVRVYMLGGNFRFTAEVLRDAGASTSQVGAYIQSRDVGEYLSEGFTAVAARLDSTGVLSVIVRDTPRLSPYQNGATLVLFFVSFVPRVLWSNKPNISIGQFITDVYGSGPEIESSTAPSQIGDYYLNFGYAGVIVGMAMLGIAMRFANDFLLGSRPTAPALLAVVAIVFSVIFSFENNVAMAQARIFFFLVPIVGLHFLVRLFAGTRGAAPQGDAVQG